jgi:hypothetical protein
MSRLAITQGRHEIRDQHHAPVDKDSYGMQTDEKGISRGRSEEIRHKGLYRNSEK